MKKLILKKYNCIGLKRLKLFKNLGKMFNVPVKGTHAHAYVTSFSGQDDLKDAKIKHRTNDSIIETEFYNKCLEWRKKVAAHLKLIETEANDGELAAFASYAIAFPEGFLALVRLDP